MNKFNIEKEIYNYRLYCVYEYNKKYIRVLYYYLKYKFYKDRNSKY